VCGPRRSAQKKRLAFSKKGKSKSFGTSILAPKHSCIQYEPNRPASRREYGGCAERGDESEICDCERKRQSETGDGYRSATGGRDWAVQRHAISRYGSNVQLNDPVRERRVFIVQSSCPPVDQHVMEALAIADACRRAAASSVTWIAPYFGYARSDKRRGGANSSNGPVLRLRFASAKLRSG
jgi:N-terminal domain of ribose phosphate pyrophosphokinase